MLLLHLVDARFDAAVVGRLNRGMAMTDVVDAGRCSVPLSTILPQAPASSIEEVLDVMGAIDGALLPSDGLWWFNHLYLRVTLGVGTAMSTATAFGDPAFLQRLDVVFANLYFDALAAAEGDPGAAPPAWRPLLGARLTPHLHPLQFALAGMDAHINRDLPWGIVTVFEQFGGSPSPSDVRHDDFLRVNGILEGVEQQIKNEFVTGAVATIDALSAPLDDHLAMWNVRAARDAAWTNAEVLWALKPTPALQRDYFNRLDRFTGFAARGLLAPVSPATT